jgi:hypothetical protein
MYVIIFTNSMFLYQVYVHMYGFLKYYVLYLFICAVTDKIVIMVLFMTPNYVTITITKFHTISMWYIIQKIKKTSHTGYKNLYDDIHYLWVTMQPVMNILLNLFT